MARPRLLEYVPLCDRGARYICVDLPSTVMSAIRTLPLSITPTSLKRSAAAVGTTTGALGAALTTTGAGASPRRFFGALAAPVCDGSPDAGINPYSAHATPPAAAAPATPIQTVCSRATMA